ncbi:hypothetical protein LTS18_007145, partial [Coniosporium uncinatum]
FLLLHLVGQFLTPDVPNMLSPEVLQQQRQQLRKFVATARDGEPSWGEAVISPIAQTVRSPDGRQILGLDKPGPELEGSGKKGIREWVVKVRFSKEGPRQVDVGLRDEVFAELKESRKEKL